MTTFFLVRHAEHRVQGAKLVGRMPGIGLSELGRRQAERLGQDFAGMPIEAVHTGPLDRAVATARAIGTRIGCEPVVTEALDEVDFGAWTGRTFAELEPEPPWRMWNSFRSGSRPPGGEAMLDVQQRAVGFLERLRREHGETHMVLVSHADVIRAVLAYHLGMPLDLMLRLEVAPASVSTLVVTDWDARLLGLNAVQPG